MTHLKRFVIFASAAATLAGSVLLRAAQAPVAPAAVPGAVDFTRDIQPIFKTYCAECHGPKKGRARLRLHTPDLVRKGGESGAILVPGNSQNSLLIHRVLGLDGDDRMPLDADPLPADVIARLRAWIDQGARGPAGETLSAEASAAGPQDQIQEHWAYVKPSRPALPDVAATAWVRSPIDRFVLARLEGEKLAPAPEAVKTTLLRRVTLDLTGLPPAPAEVQAFLADAAPDAYQRVVDRLLASPRYGERWARPWLDLARYADTNGYEKDNRRSIWKYRDWVIEALNRDLPFTEFTIEQIAGDMLPNATAEQKIASGFHRNAMTNEEGGVDPEESRYEALVDRVNTTSTVWLGTTLGCAQCHNHKYDPFSQKDYYRMLAFFASADYESRSFGDGTRFFEPTLDLATPEQESAYKTQQAEIDRLEQVLKTATPELAGAQQQWEASLRTDEAAWTPLTPESVTATNGVVLTVMPDGSVLASGPNPKLTSYALTAKTTLARITGLQLEALPDATLPRGGPGRDAYGHFRITGLGAAAAPLSDARRSPEAVPFETLRVDDSAGAFDPALLLAASSEPGERPRGSWAVNAMRDTERLPRHAALTAAAPFGFDGGTRITLRIDQLDGAIGQGLGRFRVLVTDAPAPLQGVDLAPRLRQVLHAAPAERTAAQADELAAAFRATTPILKPAREALASARKALAALEIPSTLVMRERSGFERPSFELRVRGSFAAKGERVYARTPAALHPMRDDQPVNRLGLARWLVDENNPLVARVAVNRIWEQLFGRGIVETSEDFGSQGAPPSHPELLDWLATEFVAKGWSQKTLLREIVLSATYRQTSAAPLALVERDPYNRLLARGPRVRMEAEMIRDVALAASGLLSTKMFGPGVFPLQPDGIWNQPYSSDKWTTSSGEDRYRRSLYTFWRRTSPYPSFMTFDATSREYCTVRRVRTNTPLQALTLLNDPASFEAARALAGRMRRAAATTRERAAEGVRLVLSREGTPLELTRLAEAYDQELQHYRTHPDAAVLVAGAPEEDPAEISAWTLVASMLLNLDEAVTKE
ncbi:MAG: PSD1 and planctomycete cytochrome C domain-containing protein [Acidobacteriota bacterium]